MILLHIVASPKGELSHSIKLAESFLETYKKNNPDDEIRTLNVFERELPEFGSLAALAKFAPIEGKERTSEEKAIWQEVKREIQYFDQADKILLSCPMWNYSIPWRLKQYIDCIVQPIETFGFDFEKMEHVGLLRNRPIQFILTRSSTHEGDANDFQLPYLKYIFELIGITDARTLVASSTTNPDSEKKAKYIQQKQLDASAAAAVFHE